MQCFLYHDECWNLPKWEMQIHVRVKPCQPWKDTKATGGQFFFFISYHFTSHKPKKNPVNHALYTSANISNTNKYIGNKMQNNFGIFYHLWSRISIEDWMTATVAFMYYLKTDFIEKREPSATYILHLIVTLNQVHITIT